MSKINTTFVSLLLLFFFINTFSQDISGDWMGVISINNAELGIAFHIKEKADSLVSTMDIPKQGLSDAKAASTKLMDNELIISFPNFKIEYKGSLNDNGEIIGNLIQGGFPIALSLKRGTIVLNRPQEPTPPFDYYVEEVSFVNSIDQVTLTGTLTLPKKDGKFPVVVIVSGSGPQNRDGEMFGHKPYLLLADQLTRNGIGVLRFDERGTGKSKGEFKDITIDLSSLDVKSAIDYLNKREDVDNSKMGLIGHSIGGIVVPKVASENKNISFIVLLAAPGVEGDSLMLSQKSAIEKAMGLNEIQIAQGQEFVKGAYEIIKNTQLSNIALKDSIHTFYKNTYGKLLPENQRNLLVNQITGNEVVSLIKSKPSEYLEKISIPVLALNGEKDLQVLYKENLASIKKSLEKAGNKNIEIVALENLNHLFQECSTGVLSEYAEIEQTFSPNALGIMIDWIQKQTK
ncbi:alpha/beta hydrolase family protein [Aquimarina sp. SS2-1]|uniref:alpha/beta hydrolase family protein n=1 Tax=Aquimarina besae TaxID=3342247 RepID=UPI00366C8BA4